MKKIFQILLLLTLPAIVFYLVNKATSHNEQIALVCSYVMFIFVLAFIDLEVYILINELKDYWNTESVKEVHLHLVDSSYENNVLKTKASVICTSKPIDTLSKVKLYATDSNVFVKSLRDNFIWIVLVNVVVIVATIFFSENTSTPSANTAAGISLSISLADLVKKTLGFLAVILQIVFFVSQLILHRNRNNRLNAELTALK